MHNKNLYIIAGCNGAGKTTASLTILPEILNCKEFVNADEIARGLSPFQPEKVAIEAGRIMLLRIHELLGSGETFALETTLSSKSYLRMIKKAKELGYSVNIFFYWLENVQIAKSRVAQRVKEGGHNISPDVIERRYKKGLDNLFNDYIYLADKLVIFNNSLEKSNVIAIKDLEKEIVVYNEIIFLEMKNKHYDQH